MSQFIDKLKQASGGGAPMGFRAAAAKTARPKMVLVAVVAGADTAHLADIAAGADAGLLVMAKSAAGALKQAVKAVPGIPWGGWLKESGGGKVVEEGADFVVFNAASRLLAGDKTGKVLEVEPTLEPSLLKSADDLPVDAVLIAAENGPLTWRDLMLVQRGANILSKPLLVLVSQDVTAAELGALNDAGVRGVVVRAAVEGKIAEIAKMLAELPPPSAVKRAKAGPLLPRISGETAAAAEEEEEEE
jgi:hypothetical protein